MDYIFLNLKRFDIPAGQGGVNDLAPVSRWGAHIASALHDGLEAREHLRGRSTFAAFFPEAHIPGAGAALPPGSPVGIGCQGVHHADVAPGGNFGAFTSLRTAVAAHALGCSWTIVGHSEERRHMAELMTLAGADPGRVAGAVDSLLNRQAACARAAGLRVLFCIGETAEEVPDRAGVLARQIERGLSGLEQAGIVLAYEPVWAIGPGRTPPSASLIASIAAGIRSLVPLPLVYGGGLKKETAAAIGGIAELDGGLVALTRFTGRIGFDPTGFLEIVDEYFRGRAATGTAP